MVLAENITKLLVSWILVVSLLHLKKITNKCWILIWHRRSPSQDHQEASP
jgi:hypothetical protein